MEEDISKKSVTVLVVLTILISILGTLSVMNAVNDFKITSKQHKSGSQGEVSLTITEGAQPGQKGASAATGQIVMEILPSEEPEQPKILLLPET